MAKTRVRKKGPVQREPHAGNKGAVQEEKAGRAAQDSRGSPPSTGGRSPTALHAPSVRHWLGPRAFREYGFAHCGGAAPQPNLPCGPAPMPGADWWWAETRLPIG